VARRHGAVRLDPVFEGVRVPVLQREAKRAQNRVSRRALKMPKKG
jgi:hypothetical protein